MGNNISKIEMQKSIREIEESKKVVVDPTPIKAQSEERGIFNFPTQYIPKTIEEIRNEIIASTKPHESHLDSGEKSPIQKTKEQMDNMAEIQKGAMEVLNEIIALEETENFDDDFNFEKTMVLYYKAMTALLKDDTQTLVSTMKQLESELQKMGEKRQKEYQKIIDRMSREKWFNLIGVGGTVAAGLIGIAPLVAPAFAAASGIAAGTAVVGTATLTPILLLGGAVAGTAILGLMGLDTVLGNPVKEFASDLAPKSTVVGTEVALGVIGTLLHAIALRSNPIAGIIGIGTSAVSEIGKTVTGVQNKYTEKELETLGNLSELTTTEIEEIGRYLEFISETLKKHIQSCRQIMKQPKIFT